MKTFNTKGFSLGLLIGIIISIVSFGMSGLIIFFQPAKECTHSKEMTQIIDLLPNNNTDE